jgi:hypothetical protein
VAGCEEKNTLDRKKLLCFVGGETASRKEIDEFLSQSTREACHLYHSEELRDEESLMQRAERRGSGLHCTSFSNDMSAASFIEARYVVPL